jgi:hypothetical protein
MVRAVGSSFEMREPQGPWGGHQPKCEKLTRLAANRYAILGRLDSGQPVTVPLGKFAVRPDRPDLRITDCG